MKSPPRATNQSKTPSDGDTPHRTRRRDRLPCEIPPLSRNNYYTGKLLTERELTAEQRFHMDTMRLHNVSLHGWGVACGLKVVPHHDHPERYLVVEPGLAVDGAGREIYVRSPAQVALPKPTSAPLGSKDPCPPDYSAPPPPQGKAPEPAAPKEAPPPITLPPYPDAPHACADKSELYVRLRYVECETEFTPAPFDDCGCNGDGEKPNRIVSSYEIDVLDDKPADWDKVVQAVADCVDDCDDIYGQLLGVCPQPCWPAYVPLAVVERYAPGDAVTPEMIDNRENRPLLPSTRRLDQIVRCILDKVPTRTTTRVRDFNWLHGHSYHCSDFFSTFIEDQHGHKNFFVAFSNPVVPSCLTPQVFQATVVRHERGHEGGFVEVVPAAVWAENDGSKFYLGIEKHFADKCLRGASFDFHLTLRCDVVVDKWGVPVDGDLLARLEGQHPVFKPPTGNGIPGGTFQSWFRVHA